MEWTVTDRPELLVIGWAVRTTGEDGRVDDLLSRARDEAVAEQVPHVAAPETLVAVRHDYAGDGAYTEVVGAQTTTLADVPDGMVGVRTAEGPYAVVPVRGEMPAALAATWKEVQVAEREGRLQRAYTTDYELHRERGAFVELHLALAG